MDSIANSSYLTSFHHNQYGHYFISRIMNRRLLSLMIVILFLVPGCTGTDVEEPDLSELEEWGSYYVDSVSDLPDCDSSTMGRLYYVASASLFYACTEASGWLYVDLTGPAGPQGQPGMQGEIGPGGENGTDGQDGVDGQDGADGQDGTVILPGCELVPWGHCQGADLSNMDLSNMDLTGINLRGSIMLQTNLSGAVLEMAIISESEIISSDFNNAQLQKADFSGSFVAWTNLSGTDFDSADARGSQINFNQFQGANFHSASLQNTHWTNNNLSASVFDGADLSGSTMTSAYNPAEWYNFSTFKDSSFDGISPTPHSLDLTWKTRSSQGIGQERNSLMLKWRELGSL